MHATNSSARVALIFAQRNRPLFSYNNGPRPTVWQSRSTPVPLRLGATQNIEPRPNIPYRRIRSVADTFYNMAEPYIKEVIKKDMDLKKIAALVKTRIEVFPEIGEMIDFFEAVPEYDVDMYTNKKNKTNAEKSLPVLQELLPVIEAQEDFTNDALYQMLRGFADEKGYKPGFVMWPVRTAVSGKRMTPGGATEIMEIIGKDETVSRIKAAIEKLSK